MQLSNDSILLKELSYNATEGTFFVLSSGKQIIPNEDLFCFHYTEINSKKKVIKIKADRLACLLGFGKPITKEERVLHRNLVESDCRLRNLLVVQRKVYLEIEEAKVNLDGRLRLVPHPTDQLSYFLCWRHEGRNKRELVYDVVVAKKKLNKLQLKYSKILTKYCIFDI